MYTRCFWFPSARVCSGKPTAAALHGRSCPEGVSLGLPSSPDPLLRGRDRSPQARGGCREGPACTGLDPGCLASVQRAGGLDLQELAAQPGWAGG